MIAIILGAGEGNRLRPHTSDRPKCLVELAGKSMLQRECEALRACGVEDIHVVTGYRSDQIERLGHSTFHNPEFASTNMVTSFLCARELLRRGEDVLVSYADIVYEPRVIEALLESDAEVSLAVNTRWRELWEARMEDPLSDAETLKVDAAGNLVEIGKKANSYNEVEGQYMGLILFRADAAERIEAVHKALEPDGVYDGKDLPNMYMTSFLQHWVDHVSPVRAVMIDGGWLEVDTVEDLAMYQGLIDEGRLNDHCRLGD
ncbi:MAG: nucleotidyl transferase [Deltaproteobacteria bacterium]|nr:nucleotidyl transferase [Deltaproteobacteria bacterium]